MVNRRDQYHAWATGEMARLHEPLLTCEAAMAEAAFLVTRGGGDAARLADFVVDGVLVVRPIVAEAAARIAALMRTYADLPMSFADASLVALAERERDAVVFTTDSDFRIYRQRDREPIPLLIPE